MFIHEQIAVQIATERIENAARDAKRMRAIRSTQMGSAVRIRLGKTLVRLGQWFIGQAPPPQPTSSASV